MNIINFSSLRRLTLVLSLLTVGVRAQAEIPPAPTRWMFGAKYAAAAQKNLSEVTEAAATLIRSCPGYERAGFGLALKDSSSDYDVWLFVDSPNATATFEQAGCMVYTLEQNLELADTLMSDLVDAAEIGYNLTLDLGQTYENATDLYLADDAFIQAHFVRFRDFQQRDWFAQRAQVFTGQVFSEIPSETVIEQSGQTTFPEAFLRAYPNDVHFGAVVGFQKSIWQTVAKFWRYIVANPSMPGNVYAPNNEADILESKSVLCKIKTVS